MTDYTHLLDRLTNATGADRNLDYEIAKYLGWTIGPPRYVKAPDGTPHGILPNWTSSIDAAMSLVPEGFNWASDPHFDIREFRVYRPYDGITQHHFSAIAKTPAIALCIASLRARMSCDATQEAAQ